jgi:hypothetical protein
MLPKPKIFSTATFPTKLTIHVQGIINQDEVVKAVDRILGAMLNERRRMT